MNPQLASSCSIERHDGVITRQNVHRSVNHDGVKQVFTPITCWITPGKPQLANVGSVDLIERRILCSIRTAGVVSPRGMLRCRDFIRTEASRTLLMAYPTVCRSD